MSFRKQSSVVGWAKPTGPREARPDDRLRVPTTFSAANVGGHGAIAPLPTLRTFAGTTTKSKQRALPIVDRWRRRLARRCPLRGLRRLLRCALLVGDREQQLRVVIVGVVDPRRHLVPGELA